MINDYYEYLEQFKYKNQTIESKMHRSFSRNSENRSSAHPRKEASFVGHFNSLGDSIILQSDPCRKIKKV